MKFPRQCLVDTNVPKTANLQAQPDSKSDVCCDCILTCIEAVEHVCDKCCLIIDEGDEIYGEYQRQLSIKGQPGKGQPGIGDKFMKWVHDNRYNIKHCQRVPITKSGESYKEFPNCEGLNKFDKSDRKFIAVANAHLDKPPILQATDSKWWGFRNTLGKVHIKVEFLCPKYVERKYEKKMGV